MRCGAGWQGRKEDQRHVPGQTVERRPAVGFLRRAGCRAGVRRAHDANRQIQVGSPLNQRASASKQWPLLERWRLRQGRSKDRPRQRRLRAQGRQRGRNVGCVLAQVTYTGLGYAPAILDLVSVTWRKWSTRSESRESSMLKMSKKSTVVLVALFLLAGCLENNAQRGVAGAAGGAVISSAVGGSPVTGAVVGGAAGYFCKDLNVPGCRN